MPVAVAGVEREPFAGYPLIGRAPILVAGAGRVPTAGRVRVGTPELGGSDITAALLDPTDPTLTTVLVELDPVAVGPDDELEAGPFDRSWLEQLNDAGNASITFDRDDENVALIDDGSLIRLSLRGERAVVMLVEPTDETIHDPGEDNDETITFTGRLHVARMEWALVEGSRGVGQKPVQENRNFDYTEEQYDDSWWLSPAVLGTVGFMRAFYYYVPGWIGDFTRYLVDSPDELAREFPDAFAWVLGAPGATPLRGRPLPLDSGGDQYGRQWVTFPSSGTYRVFGLGDDTIEVMVGGVQVVQAGTGSMSVGSGDVDVSAGLQLVSWHVNSHTDAQVAWSRNPSGAFNAAYGGWTISRADDSSADGFIAHSDHTAKVTPYLDKKPAMSPGLAARLVNEENTAAGVLMPTLGCTDAEDRDGNPWATDATPTRVGNDAFTWHQEMGVTCTDFAMSVDEYRLDLWNHGGKGVVRTGFSFHGPTDPDDPDTTNIAKLHRKKGTITNSFLVRAGYGWDTVERQSSIDEHGKRRAMLSLGSYNDPAAVHAAANKQLDIVAVERVQYDLEHDPANPAEFAYIGFEVGDWILLVAGGESAYRRVVSIAPAEQPASDENNTGEASVVVTLGDVVMYASPLEFHVAKLSQAVKKLANGSGLGDFVIAQPVTPPAVATPISAWTPPFSYFCAGDAFSESFAQGDSTTLGPDLTWEKLDTTDPAVDVGPDDGEVHSGAFGVYGGTGSAAPGPGNSFTVRGKSLARADAEVNCPGMFAEVEIAAMDPDAADVTHGVTWTVFLGVNLGDEVDAVPSGGFGLTYGLLRWVGIYVALQFNNAGGLDNYRFFEISESGGFSAEPGSGSGGGITAAPGDVFRLRHVCTPTENNIQLFYNGVAQGVPVSAESAFDDYVGRSRGAVGAYLISSGSVDVRRLYRLGPFGVGDA